MALKGIAINNLSLSSHKENIYGTFGNIKLPSYICSQ
jgi:hypothetical protein